jgi:hypothetical protein
MRGYQIIGNCDEGRQQKWKRWTFILWQQLKGTLHLGNTMVSTKPKDDFSHGCALLVRAWCTVNGKNKNEGEHGGQSHRLMYEMAFGKEST